MPGYDLIWHHQQVLSTSMTVSLCDLHDPKQRRREVRLLFGSREVVYLSLEAETPANCSCMTTIFTYSYGALKVDTDNLKYVLHKSSIQSRQNKQSSNLNFYWK